MDVNIIRISRYMFYIYFNDKDYDEVKLLLSLFLVNFDKVVVNKSWLIVYCR